MSLQQTLDALGLTGSFAIAKKVGGTFLPAVFNDAEKAEAWLEDAEDAWITGNPVREGCPARPTATDVTAAPWLLFDADPEKTPDDPDGLAEWKREAALEVVESVREALDGSAHTVFSGRGAQAWILVGEGVPRRKLIRYLATHLTKPGVKIDATHDPSRLMRLPGYVNSRTGDSAMLLQPCTGEAITAEEAAEMFGDWVEPVQEVDAEESFDDSSPNAFDLAYLIGEPKILWDSDPDGDRSMRDYAFLRSLLANNVPERAACRLLYALPHGKASEDERDVRYWVATLKSVYTGMEEERQRRERLEALLTEAEEDPGAPFQPQALADMAWLQRWDLPGWQRVRAELKKLKSFALSDLERAIGNMKAKTQGPPDHVARCVKEGDEESFWMVKVKDGWMKAKDKTLTSVLAAAGESLHEARNAAANEAYRIDAQPFGPMWLEGRRYNVSKAHWKVDPVEGDYSMWEQVLDVVGRGLDDAVAADEWCKENGIVNGGCYLFAWLACMAQHPRDRVAWLFCFSAQQNIGKSYFAEAVRDHLLTPGGCVQADKAITNERGFNSELEGAVLCRIEETNIGRKRTTAYDRAKQLISDKWLTIEAKGGNVRMSPNWTHIYQTANNASYCPLFGGDSRITAWEMLPPKPEERHSKAELDAMLSAEAPAFLHALLSWPVPEGGDGRLRVPAITTTAKIHQQQASRDLLELWLERNPEWIGWEDDEIVHRAQRWLALQGEDTRFWRRPTILRGLPSDSRTLQLRGLVEALRAAEGFEGTADELAAKVGWKNGRALGIALKELEVRGVTGWTRRRTNKKRVVTIGKMSPDVTMTDRKG